MPLPEKISAGFFSKLFSHKNIDEAAKEIAETYADEINDNSIFGNTECNEPENVQISMPDISDTGETEYEENEDIKQNENAQNIDSDSVRRHIITFRVNDAELDAINRRFAETNFRSRGDFCRYSALTVMNVEEDNESLLASAKGISSVSNSFNQIAHRMNSTGHIYQTEIDEMKRGMNEIWQLLTSIRYTKERTMQLLISSTRTKPQTAGMLLATCAYLLHREQQNSSVKQESMPAPENAETKHSI